MSQTIHHHFHPPVQWIIHGLGLLTLALVMGINFYQEYWSIEEHETKHLLRQTRLVCEVLEHDFSRLQATLDGLRHEASLLATHEDSHVHLELLTKAVSGARTFSILDAQGIVRASNDPALVGQNESRQPVFAALSPKRAQDSLVLVPASPAESGKDTVTAGLRIDGPDGAFAGAVIAALSPQFFAPLLDSARSAPELWAGLAHADGTVLLMEPATSGLAGAQLNRPESFFTRHRVAGQDVSVCDDALPPSGDRQRIVMRTVGPHGLRLEPPLYLMVALDRRTIHAGWRQDLLLQGGALVILILLSTLLLLGFQKRQRDNARRMAEASEKLAQRERFIRTVMDNVPTQIAYWNAALHCEYANAAYLDWFGTTFEAIRRLTVQELLGETLLAQSATYLQAALAGEPQLFERGLPRADGSTAYTQIRYLPDRTDGEVRGMYVLASDVTELKATQKELEQRIQELDRLATTDTLTGIPNRRVLLEQTTAALHRSQRYGEPLAFLMLDIDHFKRINDNHGHDIGDVALRLMAETLQKTVRTTDHIGRLGGEEFGAVLIQTTAAEARVVAERLCQALRDVQVPTPAGPLRFTVSIGLSMVEEGVRTEDELIKRADLALYRAKETGRDKVCNYEEC